MTKKMIVICSGCSGNYLLFFYKKVIKCVVTIFCDGHMCYVVILKPWRSNRYKLSATNRHLEDLVVNIRNRMEPYPLSTVINERTMRSFSAYITCQWVPLRSIR